MNQFQLRTFASLERSDGLVEQHKDVLGSIASSEARQELQAVIAEARQHYTDQGTADRSLEGQMSRQIALAKELVHAHLRPIATFAGAKLRGVPEFAELTKTGNPEKPKQLVGIARSMAVAAAKYSNQFTSAGLAADTVTRLTTATDALADAISQRANARGKRKNSTNNLDTVLARGREAVHVLESAITQVLKSDDPLLATWKSESRIEDKPGKPRRNKNAVPAAVPAPVAPAPALTAGTTQHT